MAKYRTQNFLLLAPCLTVSLVVFGACNLSSQDQRERDQKTRDEVAKATERAKPVIEEAGRKVDNAVRDAAHEVKAAAQGAHDGWKNGPHALVDLNSASETDLASLPGVSRPQARKIIEERPYQKKEDLVEKGVISESEYEKLRDRVTAK
jgi:DNA uptake protein ComE-like DNA-binding protein